MLTENICDLYIKDRDRNIIPEEKSVAVITVEKIILDNPWRNELQTHFQLWKHDTKFSFSIIH